MTQSEVRQMFIRANPGVKRPGKKGLWYRCAHCGKWCGRSGGDGVNIPLSDRMEVDHIRPWSQGGSDNLSNLQALCHDCNRHKSANPNLHDNLIMLKNDITQGDFIASGVRKVVRQNPILKGLGITKRK